jgi:hypothetical protein
MVQLHEVEMEEQALRIGDGPSRVWKYTEYIPRLQKAIAECSKNSKNARMAYPAAANLCRINRGLIMWFIYEWQHESDLAKKASSLGDLFSAALGALEETRGVITARPKELEHLNKMIANTATRLEICKALAAPKENDWKNKKIVELYKNMPDNRGFDLSSI